MYSSPDWSPNLAVRKVFFNGFLAQELGYGASVGMSLNPNAQALGSNVMPAPHRAWAMLGVWKDCNRDGFVGLGDQGLMEYRAELFHVTGGMDVCPPRAMPFEPPTDWFPVHNDGTWIHELLPLGWLYRSPEGFVENRDPFTLTDPSIRVWADDGAPGAPLDASSCYTQPPTGTFRTVGGVLAHVDCYAGSRVMPATDEGAASVGARETVMSVLATENPWGSSSDASVVEAWDCQSPIVEQDHPVPASAYQPQTSGRVQTAGTPGGTLAALFAGFDHCRRGAPPDGRFHAGDFFGGAPYAIETDAGSDQTTTRHQSDFTLKYAEPERGGTLGPLLGRSTPPWGGAGGLGERSGFWVSDGVRALSRNPYVSRETLGPEGSHVMTYYAHLGVAAIAKFGLLLPRTGLSVYGAEACLIIQANAPPANGWECSPNKWWPNATVPRSFTLSGIPSDPTSWEPIGAYPGFTYELRDVDCYDGSADALRPMGIGYFALSQGCP